MCVCIYIFVWVYVCVYTYMHGECGVLSCVQLFMDPMNRSLLVPPSMGFFRQEYWSGLLFPSPGNFPDLGIEPTFPVSPTLAGRLFFLF